MAENKKSFVAYSDWHGMFKALPDDVAGKLIKHVFSYVNDQNPETDDYVINALFEQIKATLKRDLQKWDKQREQRSEAGKRSAEIRSAKSNDRSTTVNENERKSTVSDNVSVSVSVNDNVTVKNNSIEERKLKFASALEPFVSVYGRDTIKAFYFYWTEPNKSNTKFRQELEKTWSLERRLSTWVNNESKFKEKSSDKKESGTVESIRQRLIDAGVYE